MNKFLKILLALVTLWPMFYVILFMAFFVLPFDSELFGVRFFSIILPLHLLTMLIIAALLTFYLVNLFRNKRIDNNMKALWAVVMFMGSLFALPVYWYLFIWKEGPVTASQPAQLGSMNDSAWTSSVYTQSPRQQEYVPPRQPPNWRD